MLKVIHLVPYDGIGGVEIAARSMAGHSIEDIKFRVEYIYPSASSQRGRYDTFSPWPMLRAVRRILASKPDLLIVSLWRSCLVALLSKCFSRHLNVVLFLHSPSDVHWLDRFATRCTAATVDQIWADSEKTLNQRLPSFPSNEGRIISFVTHRISPLPGKAVSPVFMFWGRLHPLKGLDRALGIFAAVHKTLVSARFIIIGPDGGYLARIKDLVNISGLKDAVQIFNEMDFNAISEHARSASFYLQTSLLEGMAMSVIESMQLGLVPIVTPVGEIGNYCQHNENALLVQTDEAIVKEILLVLQDNVSYQRLRGNAVATWNGKPLYAESVLQACADVLLKDSAKSQCV